MVDISERNKLRVPFMANPWFRKCMVGFIQSSRGMGLHSLLLSALPFSLLWVRISRMKKQKYHRREDLGQRIDIQSWSACLMMSGDFCILIFLQPWRPCMIQDEVGELLRSCCSKSISLHRIRCRTLSKAPCCALQHGFGTGLTSTVKGVPLYNN